MSWSLTWSIGLVTALPSGTQYITFHIAEFMHYSTWTLASTAFVGSVFLLAAGFPDNGKMGSRCHSSYPDYCIAPGPPDLNCPDITGPRPFRVRHDVADADPHGFDRDRDGLGCETGRRRSRQD